MNKKQISTLRRIFNIISVIMLCLCAGLIYYWTGMHGNDLLSVFDSAITTVRDGFSGKITPSFICLIIDGVIIIGQFIFWIVHNIKKNRFHYWCPVLTSILGVLAWFLLKKRKSLFSAMGTGSKTVILLFICIVIFILVSIASVVFSYIDFIKEKKREKNNIAPEPTEAEKKESALLARIDTLETEVNELKNKVNSDQEEDTEEANRVDELEARVAALEARNAEAAPEAEAPVAEPAPAEAAPAEEPAEEPEDDSRITALEERVTALENQRNTVAVAAAVVEEPQAEETPAAEAAEPAPEAEAQPEENTNTPTIIAINHIDDDGRRPQETEQTVEEAVNEGPRDEFRTTTADNEHEPVTENHFCKANAWVIPAYVPEEKPEETPAPTEPEPQPVQDTPAEEPEENEDDADDETPEAEEGAENGFGGKVIVRRKLYEKFLTAEDDVLSIYNEIKNELLSYGLKSRLSSSSDTFRAHRQEYAKLTLSGKHVNLYLAIDPETYEGKAKIKNVSEKSRYANVPSMLKIKSGLSLRKAKKAIAEMMSAKNFTQKEVGTVDYASELKAKAQAEKDAKEAAAETPAAE